MEDLNDYIGQARLYAVQYNHGDTAGIEILAKIAHEAEAAKQKLRKIGIGWTGLSLLKTVDEVDDEIKRLRAEIKLWKTAHMLAIRALNNSVL